MHALDTYQHGHALRKVRLDQCGPQRIPESSLPLSQSFDQQCSFLTDDKL